MRQSYAKANIILISITKLGIKDLTHYLKETTPAVKLYTRVIIWNNLIPFISYSKAVYTNYFPILCSPLFLCVCDCFLTQFVRLFSQFVFF